MTAHRRAKKRRRRRAPRWWLVALACAGACAAGFLSGRWTGSAPGAAPYLPTIAHWCDEYNVNRDMAAAVLEAESAGRARAISSAGARGLMQLMPRTAEAMAGELGLARPSADDLFDPELNIRLGVYYLSKLRERFGDEREFVLAAYHAGPTRVDAWRRSRADLSAAEVLGELAFPATRAYVTRVLSLWKRRAGSQ